MSITDNMTKEERKEYWELVMEEYADSDLSKRDFCNANDINPSTFNYWENRLEELNESNEEDILITTFLVVLTIQEGHH